MRWRTSEDVRHKNSAISSIERSWSSPHLMSWSSQELHGLPVEVGKGDARLRALLGGVIAGWLLAQDKHRRRGSGQFQRCRGLQGQYRAGRLAGDGQPEEG